jgi:hypothetical protein
MQPENQDNKAPEKIEQAQSAPQEPAPEIKSEENKTNWAAFRQQREVERKAKEESDRRAKEKEAEAIALRAALEAAVSKPYRQNDNNDHGDIAETEEQRIDKRVREIIAERELEFSKKHAEKERQEAPQRILQTYPDFNQVVTTENCDYLDYHYPELTAPFKYMPEGYDKWNAMYKAVKKLVPNPESKKDMQKADKNLNKPGSISSVGNASGANAMPSARLDEQRKSQNWERMQKVLKGLT